VTGHDNSFAGQFAFAAKTNARLLPAAATAAATAVSPRSAEATTPPGIASRFRTSFVHVHRTAMQLCAVQLGNRVLRFCGVRHFDEGEAARLSRIAIRNNVDTLDVPELGEGCLEIFLRR
jgi:hypothetical protein